jgi:hypothetical protein
MLNIPERKSLAGLVCCKVIVTVHLRSVLMALAISPSAPTCEVIPSFCIVIFTKVPSAKPDIEKPFITTTTREGL